jgi:hypothetical protein
MAVKIPSDEKLTPEQIAQWPMVPQAIKLRQYLESENPQMYQDLIAKGALREFLHSRATRINQQLLQLQEEGATLDEAQEQLQPLMFP